MSDNPLDIRTVITQVSQALVDAIDLGFRYRYPAASNVEELRHLPSLTIPNKALRFVTEEGVCYRFLLYSSLPHSAPSVIRPTDRAQNGRWVRTQSKVTMGPNYFRPVHREKTGYARAVQRYEGDLDNKTMLERIYAQRPAFLVRWTDDEVITKSTVQGGLFEYNLSFILYALACNYRPEQEVLEGSDVSIETDPGLDRMIGDLRYLLAGSDLGLGPGIKYCDIQGAAKIIDDDLSQRSFIAEIPLLVRASVHRADEDLVPLKELSIQTQLGETRGQDPFDRANYLKKGYRIDYGNGLTATPSSGIAYIGGELVASSPGAHTFTPNKDTYRDLGLDGLLRYAEVEHDEDPPPQEKNTLRIAMSRTNATDIIYDGIIAPSLEDYGDPFLVPKPRRP